MQQASYRELALADLADADVERMMREDETLFVEHKSGVGKEESFQLVKAVTSFANELGGWVLLGVTKGKPNEGEHACRLVDCLGWEPGDPRQDRYELTLPDEWLERAFRQLREWSSGALADRSRELRGELPHQRRMPEEFRLPDPFDPDELRYVNRDLDVLAVCDAVLEGTS